MTRYLISFHDGAMDHIPKSDLESVGRAAHEVVYEAIDAGVWFFGAGIGGSRGSVVATDGTVTAVTGPSPIGGFAIVDVPSLDQATTWAARFATACRCAQDVRELMSDPEQEEAIERARVALGTSASHAKLLLFGERVDERLVQLTADRDDVELVDLDRLYAGD